jgi:poly(3-hydroxybutyrate) depolymerase/PKD repeat protein
MKTRYASLLALAILAAAPLAFANQAPTVSITSPANEYEDAIGPATINITANAADSDGTIAKVEFFQNGTLIGTDTTSPYSFSWTGVASGRYNLTAKATDNAGTATTSASVWITVNGPTVNGFLDKKLYTISNSPNYMQYRLWVPPNYNAATKYPVVLFLHGVGEGGTDNTKQLNNNLNQAGVFVNAANQAAYPTFMIAPQSNSGWWAGNGTQTMIVQHIEAKYNIDANRRYITGLSAGGMGTWATIITYPTFYAAAVPICGNADNSQAAKLINMPIWDFHGADDPTVNVGGSDSIIAAIRAAGGKPIYTRYATTGHASWVPAYNNPKTVPWVMAQRLGVAPTNSPLLTISSPTSAATYSTNAATLNLSGTTMDASTAVTSVAWTNSLGGSGTASGTSAWSIANAALAVGDNLITVTATGTSYSTNNGGVTTFVDNIKVTRTNTANTAPTISNIADQSTNEDTAKTGIAFTVGDAETAAASLTVSGSSSNTALVPNANITFGGSGASRTVSITPAANQSGTATITVTVSDGTTTASDTFILTVNAVNDTPTINDIADQSTPENTAKSNIAFTVSDVETAAASLTVSGSSSNTTLVPNANITFGGSGASRTVTVTPAANQNGTATITITVSDGAASASDTFVLTVSSVNSAPTISNITDQSTNEDTAKSNIAFTVGDVETAAASLTVSGSSSNTTLVPNANITFGGSGANRTVSVTPAANQSGTATITVTVSDGSATASDTFVLTVNAVNDTPTISNIADQSTTQDVAKSNIPFTVGDIETAAASLTVSGSSSNTTLVPNANITFGGSGANRTVTVTPAAGQTGTATITVTVSDGSASASDTFVLTVAANPNGVVAAIDCGGTADFTAADGTVYKADVHFNGGSVNNFVRPIANTTDDALYQSYRWANPSQTYAIPVPNGTYAVTLKFADVYSTAAGQKIFDATVEGVLVAQKLDVFALVGADTAYDITVAATVTDGVLDIAVLNPAAGNPSLNAILVKTRANRAPVANAQSATTAEDTAKPLVLAGSDPDADALIYTIVTQPTHGTLSGTAPNVTYTPAANYAGADSFTFKVSDGAAQSAAATVTLNVTSVNDAPTISNIADQSTNEDTAKTGIAFTVGDAETAAASLTVSATSSNTALVPNANITLGGSGANRTLSVTPAANKNGTTTITVTVSDGVATASDSFVLTVNAVNDVPVLGSAATASPNPANANQTVTFSATATDADGDALSYAWSFGDGSTATGASTTHAYAAAGTYDASVIVTDGKGGSVSSAVTVTVNMPGPSGVKINFQTAASDTPAGYLADSGAAFADRGNGFSYGWNADNALAARDRNAANSPDQRYDTLIHMQKPENPSATWEIAVLNGTYTVRVVCGDPSYFDSVYKVSVEGVLTVNATPTSTVKWFEGTQTVTVADGRLTISSASGSANNKICLVEISSSTGASIREVADDIVAQPMTVTKLQLNMNFAKQKSDGYRISGILPTLAKDFAPKGAVASIDVGAAIVDFTLDAHGKGRSPNGTFAIKFSKKSGWIFTAALKSGSWFDEWADGGLSNSTMKNAGMEVPVTLTLGSNVFGGSKAVKCTATKNKGGKAH